MSSKNDSEDKSPDFKILNDEKIMPSKIPVMTSVPLSSTKQITLSIAKPKKQLKQKNTDHYVMKTVKEEKSTDTGIEESETIDFILAENSDEELAKKDDEITAELHLSDDDQDSTFTGATQEVVEHVCGKCFKTFRRLRVR